MTAQTVEPACNLEIQRKTKLDFFHDAQAF